MTPRAYGTALRAFPKTMSSAAFQPIDFSALLWRDRTFPKPLGFGRKARPDHRLLEQRID
jgi:hypothetical protein